MLVDWQLIEFNVLQLQDEFMSLHQFNHPRRSSLKCGGSRSYIYVDIIEHAAESASNLKQCSVMCAIIIVLAATKTANADCISRRKGISPPHFCESPLRGWGDAARKNNGDGTQEFRFISIKCKKQVP
jgi:hypothetical protein